MKTKVIFIAILTVFIMSCGLKVYFNTFYNAKKYYSQALHLRQQAALQGRDTTTVGFTELDSAIIRCGKIIQNNPTSAFIDDAVFIMGDAFLLKGEYQNAIRKFDELIRFYPNSPFYSKALVKIGIAYMLRGDYEEALTSFTLARFSDDKRSKEEASYFEIKTYVLSEDYSMALQRASEFKEEYTKSSFLLLVLLEEAEILFNQENWEDLMLLYSFMQDKIDESNLSVYYKTTLRFAQALKYLQRTDEAIEVLLDLRKNLTTGTQDAEAAIELALCYRTGDEIEKSLGLLNDIVQTYKNTSEAAKALYYSGEIYEEYYGDLTKAKEIYEQARLSNPDELTSMLAMNRSLSLDRIIEYSTALDTASGTNLSNLKFLLAELYLFELNDTLGALEAYELFIDQYPTSEYQAKALLVYSNILYETGEVFKAESLYRVVADRYPGTEYYYYSIQKLNYADSSYIEH